MHDAGPYRADKIPGLSERQTPSRDQYAPQFAHRFTLGDFKLFSAT